MLLFMNGIIGDWQIFLPAIWLLLGAGIALSIELSTDDPKKVSGAVFYAAIGGVLLALLTTLAYWNSFAETPNFSHELWLLNGVVVDEFGMLLCTAILFGTAICCFSSATVVDKLKITMADYLALVLVAATGMVLLVVSNDLIMIFLSVELMSLGIYVLAGTNRNSSRSAESAMKYLVMGAFASGFILFGMALIYGTTGAITLPEVSHALANMDTAVWGKLPLLGVAMIVIGLIFKVGGVPFHQWVPDVYTGAPTPVTGLMAVAVKTAAFGAFVRLALTLMPHGAAYEIYSGPGLTILIIVSGVTMVIGNWIALTQTNIKRMLAYSSIAHSGYLLMGLIAALSVPADQSAGLGALGFYLVVYVFGTGGAFALIEYCTNDRESDDMRDLQGLAWRRPASAVAMTVFMLSLAGIPLTGGFFGKYYLFKTAIDADLMALAFVGILASIAGAYYYLRVIVVMYMKERREGEAPMQADAWGVKFALTISAFATLYLGVAPASLLNQADAASKGLVDREYKEIIEKHNPTLAEK
ncbi:MAG: NADH-quinone oxidoreductase subunit N [Planctomycetes bacterium]|nr:NADH-quinone oxidoreductase subunit N [Planctomycetota bacterium]